MRVKETIRNFLVFVLIFLWIFSGWPRIWQNPRVPPEIQPAQAADQTIYLHPTSEGTLNEGTQTGCTDSTHYDCVNDQTGNGGTGVPESVDNTDYVVITKAGPNQQTELFNLDDNVIDSDAIINQIDVTIVHVRDGSKKDGRLGPCYHDGSQTCGALTTACTNGETTTTQNWDFSGAPKDITWLNGLEIGAQQGNDGDECRVLQAYVKITYNEPPNNPSQDIPANGATDVSITPNFKMTATDPDSDNLGYRVAIYSDSGCSTVVQTYAQAVDATGWVSTDASCTNNPTSCYTSGTQGDFTVQLGGEVLSNSTQYWWEAAAFDPDNNGTYATSTTCNTFTTLAAVNSLPVASGVSIDSGAASVTLTENTTKSVSCAGTITDNDGYTDISQVCAFLYRSSVATSTIADNNNYKYTLCGDSNCVPSGGSGNTENYDCMFSVQYYAHPTDAGSPWSAQNWVCEMWPENATATGTVALDDVEMDSLLAIDVSATISYGMVLPDNDTGGTNQTVTITNTGNRDIDVEVSGDLMCTDYSTCAGNILQPAQQEYSVNTFAYGAGTSLTATTSPVQVEVDLATPSSTTTPVADMIYWGVGIPIGQTGGSYTGQNTFTAVAD